ncbi:MAG: translation elongation factor Ts [Aquificota bacterium]|nr:translation elongation factor Ts [Aquificota bacterium]MDQ7081612.1 translation elongation factor Ts [Aquificota bacterium]
MGVSIEEVKRLREMTGAGMLDCKKALEEAGGDIEKAKEILRVKGLAKAEKKAARETREGVVQVKVSGDKKRGVILEVNCETDFVARNEEFRKLVDLIADHILSTDKNRNREGEGKDIEDQPFFMDTSKTLGDVIKEAIAKIGENIRLSRFVRIDTENSLHSYVHGGGRIGVILEFRSRGLDGDVLRVVQDVALQIAAMRPEYVSVETVPDEVIDRERRILREQALREGKPEHIIDRIVEGKLRKFYEEKVLMEQAFIKDENRTVKEMLESSGSGIEILRFVRFEIGGL